MRVSINLSAEMLDRVDQEAKRLGTSRGAMLTTWVGEKIATLDMSRRFTSDVQDNMLKFLKESLSDPDVMKNIVAASSIDDVPAEIGKEKKKRK